MEWTQKAVRLGLAIVFLLASSANAEEWWWQRHRRYCPPSCETAPPEDKSTAEVPSPTPSPITTADTAALPDLGPVAQALTPYMIGDSPGGACGSATYKGVVTAIINHPFFACTRDKIADNNSPLPIDRVYFDFQFFQQANQLFLGNPTLPGSPEFRRNNSFERYTFGIEKTFFDGLMSAQLRVPIHSQPTNRITIDSDNVSITDNQTVQFGNMTVVLKGLFYRNDRLALSGGMLIGLPTAPDVTIHDVELDGDTGAISNYIRVRNENVILSPFLGFLYTPNPRLFMQGFMEFDFDVGGTGISYQPTTDGIALPASNFRIFDPTLIRLDLGGGYWLMRDRERNGLTGLASMVEVHYTGALERHRTFAAIRDNQPLVFGDPDPHMNIVNLTLGLASDWNNRTTLSVAGIIPLTNGHDRPFDWEFRVQLNFRF